MSKYNPFSFLEGSSADNGLGIDNRDKSLGRLVMKEFKNSSEREEIKERSACGEMT
jgi:hypothetical protein